jgi:hypothetical protein
MDEATKQIISNLETQLDHRLEKLWKVFDWCSKILLAIIAFVIAGDAFTTFSFPEFAPYAITLIILIITLYAYAWIKENLGFERNIRDELHRIYKEKLLYDKLTTLSPDRAKFGYKAVILWLGFIAIAATWASKLLSANP